MKEIMVQIKKYGYVLRGLKEKKQEAIKNEEYDEAKRLKDQIDKNRMEI